MNSYYSAQYKAGFRYIHTWGNGANQTAMYRTVQGMVSSVLEHGQCYSASFNAEGKLTRINAA